MSSLLFTWGLFLLARAAAFAGADPVRPRRAAVTAAAASTLLAIACPLSWDVAYVAVAIAAAVMLTAGTSGKVATPKRTATGTGSDVSQPPGPHRRDGERRLLLLALGLALLALVGDPLLPRPFVETAWDWVCRHTVLGPSLARVRGRRVLAWGVSLLLCTGEVNGVVLLVLKRLNVGPTEGTQDLGHYKHGALIGTFERTLVFIFAANNQFNAVGFILTAKSLVRFHDVALKDNGSDGAEYVLVGTLLSTLLAIGIALLVPHLAG